MAEIVSKGQAFTGQRPRLIEVVMAAVAGATIVVAIAWAVFVSSAPAAVTPAQTTQYLQEPGLLDQRSGERGGGIDAIPGGTVLTPALQEHRRGEREGN